MQANSIQATIEIVQRTSLATMLPDALAEGHPGVAAVHLEQALPTRTIALLRRDGGYLSAAARAFLDTAETLVHF